MKHTLRRLRVNIERGKWRGRFRKKILNRRERRKIRKILIEESENVYSN